MKTRGLLAVTAILMAAALLPGGSTRVRAPGRWNAPRIVTANCSGCHGVDGNTQLPYFPKVAGIDAAYAEKKMLAFSEGAAPPVDEAFSWLLARTAGKQDRNATPDARINMIGVAHSADTQAIKAALLWYAKQTPHPGRATDRAAMERGKVLFMSGLPAQGMLACQTCHGPDGHGMKAAPRLAGQNGEYIAGQLAKFRRGDRRHAPEMTQVTRDLDPEQARDAAAYLQSQ